MKKIFSIIAMLCFACFFSGIAFAGYVGEFVFVPTSFQNYSSANGSAVYSTVLNTSNFRHKTAVITGIAVSGHTAASLAGTVAVQCCTSSAASICIAQAGLWTTAAGAALTTTANTVMEWEGVCPYTRFSWAKTTGEVSVWLGVGN